MRKATVAILAVIFISFFIGFYLYPQMPDRMAGHWNEKGSVDGYIPKFWGLFLMPIISFILFLFFLLIPEIDPLKENISKFRKYFDMTTLSIIIFLFYLYLLTLIWNSGIRFNMVKTLIPAFGILFYCCGILVEKTKRNWFIGIRTPWTLSNDFVWEKTHKIGGKLFKLSGIISFLGFLFSDFAIFFVLAPVFFTAIYTIIYSYFIYKKQYENYQKEKI